jgi:phosphonate transport system substrate-binding protein
LERRSFLLAGFAALTASRVLAQQRGGGQPLRIGLTPVFLDDHVAFLRRWREYLAARLGRPVEFVQRGSYRETVDLLRQGKLDFAWVCGYPFVRHRAHMRLLAVPLHHGRPLYRSYLIVPAADRETRSLLDLRGRIFAYSDPDSNSGFLFPNYRLLQLKERPGAFFGKAFFTWAHRKVVEAVGSRLAQGGSVDGYVWETLAKFVPELTGKTRVAERSPEFGFPPVVAHPSVPAAEFATVQRTLLEMTLDPQGRVLLGELNLDGFAAGEDALFDSIAHMARVVRGNADATA